MKNLDDFTGLELAAPMIMLNVKHTFSPDEMARESEMLAQAVTDKAAEEANKKAAMGVFKNKIDTLDAEVKLRAGHVTHGFTYLDKPTEMYRDYETSKRLYFDKANGDLLKEEAFHQSDFQKKLDFDTEEEARQQQIEENNRTGEQANGFDAIDQVIVDKKVGKSGKKEKPAPKDNLPENYGKFAEVADEIGIDHNGNPTDIAANIIGDDDLPDEDLFKTVK